MTNVQTCHGRRQDKKGIPVLSAVNAREKPHLSIYPPTLRSNAFTLSPSSRQWTSTLSQMTKLPILSPKSYQPGHALLHWAAAPHFHGYLRILASALQSLLSANTVLFASLLYVLITVSSAFLQLGFHFSQCSSPSLRITDEWVFYKVVKGGSFYSITMVLLIFFSV